MRAIAAQINPIERTACAVTWRNATFKDVRTSTRAVWEPVSFSRRLKIFVIFVYVNPSQQQIKMVIHAKFVLSVNKDYKR